MTEPYIIQTVSGRMINVSDYRATDFSINDVAHHLALENRFAGGTRFPYSVAQHSVHVADWMFNKHKSKENRYNLALCGLMHDAAEYLLKDIPSPIKVKLRVTMPYTVDGLAYKSIEGRILAVIALQAGVPLYFHELDVVKQADEVMLATEFRDLMRHSTYTGKQKPRRERIAELSWRTAEDAFLERFEQYSEGSAKERA